MHKFLLLSVLALLLSSCGLVSAPPPTCDISTASPLTIYKRASAAADVFGTLAPGETFQATAKTADGFYGFDPGVAQAGNSGLFRLRWVLKTNDLNTSAGCASLRTVVAPITGICYAMFMGATPIYSSPDTASVRVITLQLNDYAMAIAHNPGWYTLDLNVGSPTITRIGYLEESKLGGLNGPCEF